MSGVLKIILKQNQSKEKRSLIGRLRMGVLNLEIEKGRCFNVPREDRICKLCKVEVESELHFLLKCPALTSCRETLLNTNHILRTELDTYRNFCIKPYVMGNLVSRLWQRRTELFTDCVQ